MDKEDFRPLKSMSDEEIEDALRAFGDLFHNVAAPRGQEELMWAANYLTYALMLEQEARERTMNNQATIVISPDWEGMYIGDELVFQDHALEVRDFLYLLPDDASLKDIDEISLEWDTIPNWRTLPKSLEELKRLIDANRE